MPPPTGDEQPTGPLRERSPVWPALLCIVVLAVLGYAYFSARATGRDVAPLGTQSGGGVTSPTAPTSNQ